MNAPDSAPRTASLFSDQPGWGRALLASLPRSLRRVDGPEGDLALIDGRGDWAGLALALVERGQRHILLIDPAPACADRVARVADAVAASGAVCLLSERLAGNPAMAAFRDWLGPQFGTITVESVDAAEPEATALAQLRLLRAAGLAALSFSHVSQRASACLAEADGLLHERPVHIRLAAARSTAGPARHLLAAHAPAACARLELLDGGEARPATASLFTPDGVQSLPAIHEGAHRHDLRRLLEHGLDAAPANTADALRALADDMRLAHMKHRR